MAHYQEARSSIVRQPGWWNRRTAMERTLIIITFLALIAIFALVASIYALFFLNEAIAATEQNQTVTAEALAAPPRPGFSSSNDVVLNKKTNQDVCITAGCVNAASEMLHSVDRSVDPCENFYDFACGEFVRNTVVPEDKVTVDSFSIVRDKLQEQVRTIISEPPAENESTPFTLAKHLNSACLNKSIIEERGEKPLVEYIRSFGGWPVVEGDKWDIEVEPTWTWENAIRQFRESGFEYDHIMTYSVLTDLKNSSIRTMDLDQTSLGLNREFMIRGLEDKVVKAYYDYQVDLAVMFGANQTRAEKEVLDSLNFEIALANISLPNEERRNGTALYNPMTIKEIQEKYPYMQWLEYIRSLMPKNTPIDEKDIVIVDVPTFFEQLGDILARTPKRTIANYFMWRTAFYASGYLTEKLRKRKLQYFETFSGQQSEEPRWKECIGYTSSTLSISVGALYVRKYFTQESKSSALTMVKDIRKEFESLLKEIDWMDETTREAALAKAKTLIEHIGYPDELADNEKLEKHYKGLEIVPDNLLNNQLQVNKFNNDYAFRKLRESVNKTDWVTHSKAALVNALYSPLENSIQFPAGILQGKFFSADRPRYMNYAAIGSIIGHEITHGFDDQGRQFDLEGNLVDWWATATQQRFLDKAKCVIDQYGNFTEKETQLNLNGINTQGENIADNGGLKEAYRAYNRWVAEHEPEPVLPGFDYTPLQLFWMSAAQTWCSVSRVEYTRVKITTGVHSPNPFRVLGPLSNMPEFSKDFNCPLGSPMNPEHKCSVW